MAAHTSANTPAQNMRTTRNSAKAAENAIEKTTSESQTAKPNPPEDLNTAFAATPNPSFDKAMAGMQEILKSGNYLNEAFSDRLTLDEKLSLIISELYRIRETTASTEESVKILQQQVQDHDQAIKVGAIGDDIIPNEDHHDIRGRVETTESDIIDLNNEAHGIRERISVLEDQTDVLNRDMSLVKGFTQKHEKQLDLQGRQTTQMTARSMSKNFTISGLLESKNENCNWKVLEFLRSEMRIQVEQHEVKVAHRLGFHNPGAGSTKPRLMVVKVSRDLKERILRNKNKLKDKVN